MRSESDHRPGSGAAPTAHGATEIEAAIRAAGSRGRPALAAFLTAGFPSRSGFADIAGRVAEEADVLELGVPFSDPMADGVTIQAASRTALAGDVTLDWILDLVADLELPAPVLLMSYLNPLLVRGPDRLAADAAAAGVDGFIVPDLPLEESELLRGAFDERGLALVQLVTPLTPSERRRRLAEASTGFLYAVTRTGTTGRRSASRAPSARRADREDLPAGFASYARGLRDVSPRPVMAGFGIRSAGQVRRAGAHVDGVIVGSALIERLASGDDPLDFLRDLRGSP